MPRSFLSALLALVLAGIAPGADQPPTDKIGQPIAPFTLTQTTGKQLALETQGGKKATVIVFLSFDCPIASSYAPTLIELAGEYVAKGVAFLGVVSGEDLDRVQLHQQVSQLRLPFPVVLDPSFQAADALQAQITPEAFLLDARRVLRYRGRIDDSYAARLERRAQTGRRDLREALAELLAGQPVSVSATTAIGCPIVRPRKLASTGKVTYTRDVLPILQARCQECHRPGEVGPFALMTYKQAVTWAEDIRSYTQERKMPPWKLDEGVAFHNDRRLTQKEIDTLAAWVEEGTPLGRPEDAPPPRTFTEGWHLGQPDLVLTVPEEMTIGPAGRDLFRVFVLPTGLTEDRHVVAVEVRPSNRRVVHHTLNFLDRTGKGRELEEQERRREKKPGEQDQGPGYTVSMGVGFTPQGALGGWAPGQVARVLPEGTGYFLPRGSDVVLQIHYHRTGKEEKDRTSIGLYFAREPVRQRFQGMVIPGRFLFIPASEDRFRVSGQIEVQQDCTLHSVMPHMHLLGKEIKVTLIPPGEKSRTLLAIRDWDYSWQETYFLEKSIPLKAGTRLAVEAIYDNSAKNPNNPHNPPRMVFFGEQTTNEMCFVFLGATADQPGRIRFRPEGGGIRRPRLSAD